MEAPIELPILSIDAPHERERESRGPLRPFVSSIPEGRSNLKVTQLHAK